MRTAIVRRKRIRALIVLVVTGALVLVGGAGAFAMLRLTNNITTVELPAPTETTASVDDYTGAFDVLVVGSDARDGQGEGYGDGDVLGARNDVTLLLHVNEAHDAAAVISFPRDLLVAIPECTSADGTVHEASRQAQFNESLGRGGLGCVAATVTHLTGIDIAYAAETTFGGVIELSNAVGGVPVCFAGPVHDRHSGLDIPAAGTYDLVGEQALAFLRSRYGIGDGSDLARISSQQVYLSSLMRTLRSSDVLADPVKLFQIADAATRNMTLSAELADLPTLASMAKVLGELPIENITFVTYPYLPAGDRVVVDGESAVALIAQVLSGDVLVLDHDHTGRGSELEESATDPSQEMPGDDAGAVETQSTPPDLLQNVDGQSAQQQACVMPYRR